jgi:hypothetical protein
MEDGVKDVPGEWAMEALEVMYNEVYSKDSLNNMDRTEASMPPVLL